ncbi:PREDICTED: uncharacterized protein LOC108559300 [Nicrophorus vespilloides]|uniref:Uncharacterized protein LOC108559300 n=1 Tax=Nicrophorus vespilloides TaxID=110193 RepID=A0ABM1MBS5_NICVS|nr:PREDICTED: uncharacterized protein LOC108559300 [Nicrophorus vespilloides]
MEQRPHACNMMITMKHLVFLLMMMMVQSEHSIEKRYLLFPTNTIVQLSYGISVPAILPTRSIAISWTFQHNYALPHNISNFEPWLARQGEISGFDLDRVSFYEYAISGLDSFGFDGEACLLRAICELSEIPMQLDHRDNLLEQITHYILTPSIDLSGGGGGHNTSDSNTLANRVIVAEKLGKAAGNCDKIFPTCDISIMDIFTNKINT